MVRFLLDRARGFGAELALISLLAILASLGTLALPWLAGQLLADAVSPGATAQGSTALLLVALLVLTTLANIAVAIASVRTGGRVLAAIRMEAYQHIQRLPLGFHDQHRQGDLLAALTHEVSALAEFLTSTLAKAPSLVLTAAGSTVLLFVLNPALALVVPVLVPAFYIVLRLVGRNLRGISAQNRQANAQLMFLAEGHLEMLPATKAFAVEDQQTRIYGAAVERARQLAFRHDRITVTLGPLVALVAAGAAIAILLLATSDASALAADRQDLFSFLLYAALLTRPVGSLADFYGQWQIARGNLARLQTILGEPGEAGYSSGDPLGPVAGAIAFRGVTFAYSGREPVLTGADLAIAAGETVALTGENGAGKSTLISLLMRFYEPDAGTIEIDGRDIAGVQLQHLRGTIGLVPQRALLFNGTVRDNLAFGDPDAAPERLVEAARLAQALAFIEQLPQGFETEVGDHGVRLSGGQRQRIALARALVADPAVLVLDEATSMYDLDGEAAFVSACQTALKDRTVIIVTHRPASLALASRVFEVADGKVREIAAPKTQTA